MLAAPGSRRRDTACILPYPCLGRIDLSEAPPRLTIWRAGSTADAHVFLKNGIPGATPRFLSAALATLVALGSVAIASPALADGAITATLSQAPVSISSTNLETVAVTGHFAGFVAPYHYVFAVRGVAVKSGDSTLPDLTVKLVNNCSITTQSVSAIITDAGGLTATANATLDHSLCPPPPTGHHASDHVIAGPTLTQYSFVDRLRAVSSPAYTSGSAIYNELVSTGVNPAFALGTFHAESASGTRGYAVTTLNWGNMLYHSWQDAYGAVPYAPGNGYTYAKFPSWLAGIRAYAHLVRLYDEAGYVTVSEASAHWLGTVEGSARHLTYLGNIVAVMTLLPDDAVPRMTGLIAPARARGTFTASWTATDNLGVTSYQIRTKLGTGPWSAPAYQVGRSRTFTLTSGTWLIAVRAADAAENWSRPLQVTVAVDASAPVITHLSAPSLVRSVDGSFVVTFGASDNVGVTRYFVRSKKGATGTWSAVSSQTGRSKAFAHPSAGTWYIEVTARDAVGNTGPWREIRVVVPTDDRAYGFTLGTVRHRAAGDYRGTETSTSRAGAKMTVHFTGDRFYLVGTVGVGKGRMRITIDGVSFTVDEGRYGSRRATSTHYRVLLFSRALTAGPHTVVITNLGTAGRPVITVDAIGWRS